MVFKFKCADRMCYSFNCIFKPVRPIVSRIDAPTVSLSVMFRMNNTVHYRIAHVEVWRRDHSSYGILRWLLFHATEREPVPCPLMQIVQSDLGEQLDEADG